MDLAYLRTHPQHIPAFLLHQRIRETPVSGGCICTAQRLTLDDGASVFAKSMSSAPPGFFEAEGAGLAWLRAAGAVAVPEVIACLPEMLVLEWVAAGEPSAAVAERFGRDLAALHRAGASGLGAEWPGYIGRLPLDNTAASGAAWPGWFAERRLEPYLRQSVDNGALTAADAAVVSKILTRIDDLAGAAGSEPPARIHGDLWPGNLLWGEDQVWLVDPAAHGGHRETDLANLALFGGAPFGDRILSSYQESWPLADGWRERLPLHQLHLLLVHTAMFGAGYRNPVLTAARALA